jgi:hypothetical protein
MLGLWVWYQEERWILVDIKMKDGRKRKKKMK